MDARIKGGTDLGVPKFDDLRNGVALRLDIARRDQETTIFDHSLRHLVTSPLLSALLQPGRLRVHALISLCPAADQTVGCPRVFVLPELRLAVLAAVDDLAPKAVVSAQELEQQLARPLVGQPSKSQWCCTSFQLSLGTCPEGPAALRCNACRLKLRSIPGGCPGPRRRGWRTRRASVDDPSPNCSMSWSRANLTVRDRTRRRNASASSFYTIARVALSAPSREAARVEASESGSSFGLA